MEAACSVEQSLHLPAHHVTVIDGIPCTTMARTLFDLCGRRKSWGRVARAMDTPALAGLVVGGAEPDSEATLAIKSFALAFFIPLCLAMIGLVLDLIYGFSPLFFLGFLLVACLIKAASVYVGHGPAARRTAPPGTSPWR